MQTLPAQHGVPVDVEVPGLPHTAHKFELLQMVPASLQTEPAQQGWPAPPQATQVDELLLHAVPGSRHVVPDSQQAWPIPPHNLHT